MIKTILAFAFSAVMSSALLQGCAMTPIENNNNPRAIEKPDEFQELHKTIKIGEVDMFYREAGSKDNPVVLLLHGFPTSSHMYRNLIPYLAKDFYVIAPDLPGFGSTKSPPRGEYDYTFDNLSRSVEAFTEELELDEYALFVFDYGAPVGFRLAVNNPDKITAIVSQNGNVYEEGLEDSWAPIRAYWETPSQANRDALRGLLTKETTHFQYTQGVPEDRLHLVSPDAIAHDQAILDRDPELQLDLFGDYKTNVALYPQWQAYLRDNQPPLLAVWGDADPFFGKAGALAFQKDVPNAEIKLLPTGHFALESHGHEIGEITRDFLFSHLGQNRVSCVFYGDPTRNRT